MSGFVGKNYGKITNQFQGGGSAKAGTGNHVGMSMFSLYFYNRIRRCK